jgi:hypothetical protein
MQMQLSTDQHHKLKRFVRSASTSKKLASQETAQYIADMVLELRNLAKAHAFLSLQGLLEVSYYEAFATANKVEVPNDELEHLKGLSRAAVG